MSPVRRGSRLGSVWTGRPTGRAGQGLVEFAFLLPVFLLVLLGMLEFGFAFNHNLSLEYATREGARAGAAMADGSITDSACGGVQLTAANVDPLIIAAVQRVLESPGSLVDIKQVQSITIYEATATGAPVAGKSNVWTRTLGAGPLVPCLSPSQKLDFSPPASASWPASSRLNGATPDHLGVSISYTYQFRSALGSILRFFGGNGASSLAMTDRTVMDLEPTP